MPSKAEGIIQVESPGTRDIHELVRAIGIVISEMDFQLSRFNTTIEARDSQEASHHKLIKDDYERALPGLRRLMAYQQRRLRKSSADPTGIDADGISTPYVE